MSELLLSEVRAHLVDAVLGVADVLLEEGIGCFLCDEHATVDPCGVTVADCPDACRT